MKSLFKKIFFFMLTFAIIFSANILFAQEAATSPQEQQLNNPRSFALGITTLKEHGFGGKLRARWDHFALDGSVGSLPWLVTYQTADGTTTNYDFAMSFHADASCVIFINSNQSRFQNGIRLGGLYDSVGGAGALFGWTGELTFNTFAICFGVGVQYYPDLIDKLNDKFPDTKNSDMDSSYKYQPYLGVNFMWYM